MNVFDYLVPMQEAVDDAEARHPEFPDSPVEQMSIINEEAGEATQKANDIVFSGEKVEDEYLTELSHVLATDIRAYDRTFRKLGYRIPLESTFVEDAYFVAKTCGFYLMNSGGALLTTDKWELATRLTQEEIDDIRMTGKLQGINVELCSVSKQVKIREVK